MRGKEWKRLEQVRWVWFDDKIAG